MFSALTYKERRAQLIEAVGDGIIFLMGNEESPMNYTDNVYRFRQDSSFLYYIGLDSPGLAAIIDTEDGRTILFGDDFTLDHIIWMGPQAPLAERAERVGVERVKGKNNLSNHLKAASIQKKKIHFLPPYRHDNIMRMAEMLEVNHALLGSRASEKLITAVVAQRSIKSNEEIRQLEIACDITTDMHLRAMKMVAPGKTEAEVAAAIREVALRTGGDISYPIIFTNHGEILHNHHHTQTLEAGQLVLCDAGAENLMHYAGDMTRTYPVSKTFTNKQKEIYQIVLDSMEAAIKALKPGILYKDVHLKAAKVITEGLKSLGLMKGDTKAAVSAGAHALFFPHGLGHMIGLDVHDMEDLGEDLVGYTQKVSRSKQFGLKSLRLGKELESGFVLTVEPGIYFIPALIDRWRTEENFTNYIDYDAVEAYKDFGGIRIEENYLITKSGSRLLGKPLPKTITDVEAVRAESE